MDLSNTLGDSDEGVFPLTRQQHIRHHNKPVGFICHTNAGFRRMYLSERWRSKGHRYEKRNAYAVSSTILDAEHVSDVDCICIIDHDEDEAYLYDRECFNHEAREAIILTWDDQQVAVAVEHATRIDLPDTLWSGSAPPL